MNVDVAVAAVVAAVVVMAVVQVHHCGIPHFLHQLTCYFDYLLGDVETYQMDCSHFLSSHSFSS